MCISVVICTFRRSDLLSGAIESLLRQSLPADQYEILVVDNNSQDETAAIAQDFITDGPPRVRYALEVRQGLSQARNTGIQISSFDIVAFLDDDAIADRAWLASLLAAYDGNPEVWAAGGKVLPIWDGERPGWLADTMLRGLSLVDWGDERRHLEWPERIIGTNLSFRKQAFVKIGRFSTNLGRRGNLLLGNEDTEMQERIHQLGKRVLYVPQAIVYHHVSTERMTKAYFYRRSYGSGRSQAVIVQRKEGYSAMLCMAFRIALKMSARCLRLPWTLWQEDRRFQELRGLAHQYGFLNQATRLLLRAGNRPDLSSST